MGGLPEDDPWGDRKLGQKTEELINLLKNGLWFSNAPKTKWEYSNLGYALLGYIINKITSSSYEEYIAKEIWNPLGIKDATWDYTKIPQNQLVHGYSWIDDHWEKEELLPAGTFGAAGGIIISLESFSKYAILHQMAWPPRDEIEKKFIKRSSIREMHQAWSMREVIPNYQFFENHQLALAYGYGYGLFSLRDEHNRTFVGHSGGLPGFGSNWCIMPEYGLGVIFFTNLTYVQTVKINMKVLDKIVEKTALKPRQLPPSKILEERQKELIALLPTWENANNSKIFAENFFLDHKLIRLKKETIRLFTKAGKIISIGDVIPENQLRGHFIIKGENGNLIIKFALTPENHPLIQQFQIKEE